MHLVDIHCHLLPQIDDGSDSMEETTKLLKMMYEEGVRGVIVTPHYRPDMFEPSMRRVMHEFLKVRKKAKEYGIFLYLGCEHFRNEEMLQLLKTKKRPTMAGSGYVLVEFLPSDSYMVIRNYIYQLCAYGYRPIIAHVERYDSCMDCGSVKQLVDLGAYIQLNADSVLGKHGRKVKRFCKQLIQEDLVDFVASDSHDTKRRKPNLGKCAGYIERKYGKDYARRLFIDNPLNILKNRS